MNDYENYGFKANPELDSSSPDTPVGGREASPVKPETVYDSPNVTPAEPGPIYSRPEVTPTEPEAVYSKPEVTPAEPEIVYSKPDVTPAEPEIVYSKPDVTPAEPEAVYSRPDVTPAEPEAVYSRPDVTPAEPEAVYSRPDVTPAEPEVVYNSPDVFSAEPEPVYGNQNVNASSAEPESFYSSQEAAPTEPESYYSTPNTDLGAGYFDTGRETYQRNQNHHKDYQKSESQDPGPGYRGSQEKDRGSRYSYAASIPEPKKKDKKKGSFIGTLLKTVAIALVFGLVAGAAFSGVNRFLSPKDKKSDTTEIIQDDTSKSGGTSADSGTNTQVNVTTVDYTQVVEEVMPSVVAITGTFTQEGWFGRTYSGEGAGSGFITEINDDEILIGTNNHVVEGGTNITVLFNDGTSAPATVLGTDKDADLGLLSVKRSDVSDKTIAAIKSVNFSDEEVKVGQSVIAIGNALGYGQSVTTGVISAKDRKVSFTDGSMTLLQTDAAINPGNSGGILINTSGQVIGINNSKLEDTSVEGMCYAIPVSRAVPILNDLKNAESIDENEKAYLGIQGQTVNASYAEMYKMPEGVYVASTIPDSPAEKAGMQAGDVITSFDGQEISTMEGLQKRIGNKKAGTKVEVIIQRKNGDKYEEKKLNLTLGKKSDMPKASNDNQNQNGLDQGNGDTDIGNNPDGGQGRDYNWEDILPYIFGY